MKLKNRLPTSFSKFFGDSEKKQNKKHRLLSDKCVIWQKKRHFLTIFDAKLVKFSKKFYF